MEDEPQQQHVLANEEDRSTQEKKKVINGSLKHRWRPPAERAGAILSENIGLDGKSAYAKRMARQEKLKRVKQTDAALRAAKGDILRKKREKSRLRREAKQEAELKSAGLRGVHIIKDTEKLRRWSKKAQRKLSQMPADVLERVYNIRL